MYYITSKHYLFLLQTVHMGIKPHMCTICSRSFAARTKLKLHMRSHTGIVGPWSVDSSYDRFSPSFFGLVSWSKINKQLLIQKWMYLG